MNISIIAAMTKDQVIGQGNKMPWHIPEELQHFKKVTMGKPMIMGRATFESIGKRLLPGRKTIILSRTCEPIAGAEESKGNDYIVVDSIDKALQAAGEAKEVMIVGGANIYQQFLSIANKMYLSIIRRSYHGDVFFPVYDERLWQTIAEEKHAEFTVKTLEKIA